MGLVSSRETSIKKDRANEYEDNAKRLIVRTPRANANFFSLKDFELQRLVAYRATMRTFHDPKADCFLHRSWEKGYITENSSAMIRKDGHLVEL